MLEMTMNSLVSSLHVPWLLPVLAPLVLQQCLECHITAHIPEGQQREHMSHMSDIQHYKQKG